MTPSSPADVREAIARTICDQTACADFDECIWCNDPKSRKTKDTCCDAADAILALFQELNIKLVSRNIPDVAREAFYLSDDIKSTRGGLHSLSAKIAHEVMFDAWPWYPGAPTDRRDGGEDG